MKIVGGKTFYSLQDAAKYIGRSDTCFYSNSYFRTKTTVIGHRRYIEKKYLDKFLQDREDERIFCIDMTLFADFMIEKIGKNQFYDPFSKSQKSDIYRMVKDCLLGLRTAKLIHAQYYPEHGEEFERWMKGEMAS